MLVPIILSGGSGTRLWPVSTKRHPKQFHPLVGKLTLIQATVARLDGMADVGRPIVIGNIAHVGLIEEQIGARSPQVVSEPVGRNTAPAIAAACLIAQRSHDDPIVAVLSSDHLIPDVDAFQAALRQAAELAESGFLVTFGVVPDHPATGYGYIHRGEPIAGTDASLIDGFKEKPKSKVAREYVAAGHLWNSGIFVFRASAFLSELERLRPDIVASVRASLTGPDDMIELDPQAWESCPSESIDYAVMEHTDRGAVLPLDAGWNDVGTWGRLLQIGDEDDAGNVVSGDVITVDTKNSYVRSEGRLIVTIGLENIVIVETPEAIVAVHRDRTEEIKGVVARLSEELK